MIRFSHTLFALPFALLSAVLAWQETPFRWFQLAGILLCMVLARSTAMAFNRLVDQRIDSLNPRTAGRHLPAGQLGRLEVSVFTAISAWGFVVSTTIFLAAENSWPLYLSVPVLVVICGYSFAKRFTTLAHFWLGASLMIAPVAAWIAICGVQGLATPLILGAAVMFWVAGFDVIYACQDAEFDRQHHLSSVPGRWGVVMALRLAAACHAVMTATLLCLPLVCPHLGLIYLGGIGLVALLLVYEHSIVRPDDLRRVNDAFFLVNGVISVGLLLIVLVQVSVRN